VLVGAHAINERCIFMQLHLRDRLIGMVGNILEHYDNALFGLLAPFLAPLFFEKSDPLTGLILTYCMLPLGILMRPLGSIFFGWIGDLFGRTRALFCSLSGMAIATMMMGCLPTYAEAGYFAPLFLALGRILQNFCAAGESIGGAIYILERTDLPKKNLMSGIYDSSSIAGILIASAMVTLFSHQGIIFDKWRILFWIGGVAAILGILFRLKASEGAEYIHAKKRERPNLISLIKEHREALIAVICVAGFSNTTFFLAFTLMNGFIPLITSLSKTEVMAANTLLLFVDMLLLPLFAYLASRIGREKLMLAAAGTSMFCAIPLFCCLKGANLTVVILVRFVIMSLGVAFSSTYHSWSQERVPSEARYTILSLGYALGSQLIGAPTAALSLWLYKKTGWFGAPALYLMVAATLAAFFVRKYFNQRVVLKADEV
jgi:MFS transporter, MHS family, proline/betaine transporter